MATTETEGKVERTLRRLYQNRDGEITKRLSDQVSHVVLETISGGHRVVADLARIFGGSLPEPSMGLCAAAFGMNTVLGNEIAGKDKSDPQALATAISERLEAIYEGEWSEGRQGPRVKEVLDAWAADAIARGKAVTDDKREVMRQRLLAGEVTSKDLLNIPTINAQYQRAKAERAIAIAQAAQAQAAGTRDAASKFDPDID